MQSKASFRQQGRGICWLLPGPISQVVQTGYLPIRQVPIIEHHLGQAARQAETALIFFHQPIACQPLQNRERLRQAGQGSQVVRRSK
jgi:hypothetical protein